MPWWIQKIECNVMFLTLSKTIILILACIFYFFRSCKLKACSGRVCHKTIQFFFKAVPPKSNTTVVHEFLASKFNAAMNTEFLVIISNKNKHSLMVQKPLKRDLTVTLNIRNGRKEVIEHIHLFVSKL